MSRADTWGRRRLAYEIAHHTEGYYVVVGFTAEPGALQELDRVLSLADEVIRNSPRIPTERELEALLRAAL